MSDGPEELNPCLKCKRRGPYSVFRTQDSWVAECRWCGVLIDIGQPPVNGYGIMAIEGEQHVGRP